ncbi:MAG: ABC transporter permease [Thermoguttaceae bacterium]
MFERIRQMLIKEFIQVFRDPKMRAMVFVIPCMEVLVIGYAVNMDVRDIRTAVYDLDESPASRDLVARYAGSGCFEVVEHLGDDRRMQDLVDRGQVQIVLRINHGFEEDLRAGRTAAVQLILDGTDSNTAGIALGYAGRITSKFSREILLDRFARTRGAELLPARLDLRTRAWFNENLESRNYMVPGVIVIVVSLMGLLLTSMAVVREKEIGTIEQILVTPITPLEFILGKTLPPAVIAFVDVTLITLIGAFWFDVPLRGSIPLLYFATALYLLTTLGVGLFISTVSQTQQQALMGTFFFLFPAMLLSGFSFPIANMPVPVQWLTLANPLAYFLVLVRGIFLQGVGVELLWREMLTLGVMGLLILALAVRRFHKTL